MAPGIAWFKKSSNSPQSKRHREIEKRLSDDKKKHDREIKIILLGAGESGKSTIIKQMRIIHQNGFDDYERKVWKNVVFRNLTDAFLDIFEIMEEQRTELQYPSNTKFHELLLQKREICPDEPIPEEYFDCFSDLWADSGIQLGMLKGNECALHDNLIYFMENIDRLFRPTYLPSNQDILRTRQRTTGICESLFNMGNYIYRMVDVGGQRSERKKWIHAFDNVRAVLFVAAISGYDQVLVEDRNGNQMEEALMLFDEIANSKYFKQASFILFLNKIDLLQEKLQNGISPIRRYYPDFKGNPTDVLAGQKYFADKFRRIRRRETENPIFIHFTNATDTSLLKMTMKSVDSMILKGNLEEHIL